MLGVVFAEQIGKVVADIEEILLVHVHDEDGAEHVPTEGFGGLYVGGYRLVMLRRDGNTAIRWDYVLEHRFVFTNIHNLRHKKHTCRRYTKDITKGREKDSGNSFEGPVQGVTFVLRNKYLQI